MPQRRTPLTPSWRVYLVRARGAVLYAGVTTNLEARLDLHRAGKGAKFLRGRGPLELVYTRKLGDHGLALRVERRLKQLSKTEKEALVLAQPTRARLLKQLELAQGVSGKKRGTTSSVTSQVITVKGKPCTK
ncbi:MAG: GIY-YIG nuclease family protein [Planctomycetes bacterium]|nr:GIY-YIG nuclease family protein [Planctomycetota bacterium]